MEEKKFLETIEDGELDIAAYARSWEEGDNITVTCDLVFAMEQAVGVFNEQKAEIERLKKRHGVSLLRNDDLDLENYELQKQVDELKKSQVVHIHIDDKLQKEYEYELKQAVKDTAKEIIDELNSIKPNVRATYGVQEQVGVDIAINRVKTYFKQKGVEVE